MKFNLCLFVIVVCTTIGSLYCEADTKPTESVQINNFYLEHEKQKCIENKCAEKSANDKCDEECNQYACNFDGYECSLCIDPWKNCTAAFNCSNVFMDGKCDEACNNPQCLFDGRDCEKKVERCRDIYDSYCTKHYANGYCDYGCNNPECLWDGLDCEEDSPSILGVIPIIVTADTQIVANNSVRFAREIGHHLRAALQVKKDYEDYDDRFDKDMIYPWHGDANSNLKNSTEKSMSTIVYIEMDNRKCGKACFSTINEVKAYLAALASKKLLSTSFPIKKFN